LLILRLFIDHLYFITSNVVAIFASIWGMCLVHLLSNLLHDADLFSIWAQAPTGCRRVWKRRYLICLQPFLILLLNLHRFLLYLIFLALLISLIEYLIDFVRFSRLPWWSRPLILFIECFHVFWSVRLFIFFKDLFWLVFRFYLWFNLLCDLLYGIANSVIFWLASNRAVSTFSVFLGINNLSLLVMSKLMLILLLPASLLWLSLSDTPFFLPVELQLILICFFIQW